jgi:transglutaminase-like putative cysteine protease
MVQYTDATNKRIKVQVKHRSDTYTYNITPQNWAVLPLSEGNGQYKITIYRQVEDTKYSTIISETIDVGLKNDFSTFLYPNQYVDYSLAPKSVDKAYELTKFITDPLQKVAVIYDFVVDHLTYDKQEAATVQSGYLPILDEVLESGKGICFDYAALMTGMLRSQGIPCKLVVGYAGKAYHAWINVWTKESGWIDGVIFFDGANWQRMDPTFASSSNRSDSIMEYIGDGTNYTEKYLY